MSEWTGAVYLEGINLSDSEKDITLGAHFTKYSPDCTQVEGQCGDQAKLTVVKVEKLEWEAHAGNNALDTCDNNGGKRIFPDLMFSGDTEGANRRIVDLVATLKPTVKDVVVQFKVWDVDDPSDQLFFCPNGPGVSANRPCIAGVTAIDADTAGRDNRFVGPLPVAISKASDEDGKARVQFTVSMQPGNNFRAAASLMSDALNAPQTSQTDADAINNKNPISPGAWEGYELPVTWSRMLTVWRKLHVERDTMARPDVTETEITGTVATITPNAPVAGQSIVDLGQNLPDEFSDLNMYEGGLIVFSACPQGSDTYPVLLSTSNFVTNDTVTIAGLPGVCATGSGYRLTDDDDILVLPHFPDFGQIGINAFGMAYIRPEDAGPAYQTVVGFDRHLDDWSVEYGVGPWDDGCTIVSTANFWACCVVGCWEPAESTDFDPDPCPAPAVPGSEGKDSGLTDDADGKSAIFLQIILSDDPNCLATTDEPHVVTHEIVHTCNSHPQHILSSIMEDGAPKQFNNFTAETILILRTQGAW